MKKAILTAIRAVAGGKFQFEITQVVEKPNRGANLLAIMNKGDERFEQAKPRKAWMSAVPSQIKEYFNVDCSAIKEGAPLSMELIDPKVDGHSLNIQVNETTTPNEYQSKNILSTAKQYVDKTGKTVYLRSGNDFIFSNPTVVAGEPKHVFVDHTSTITEEAAKALVGEVKASAPLAAKTTKA